MRVQFGDYTFDDSTRELSRLDEPVHLTPKAFELLQILIRERPRAVSKDELRDSLWPDVVVEEANLKNLVVEIRGVLGAEVVRTVHRFGYAFAGAAETPVTTARLISEGGIHRLREGANVIGRDDTCAVVIRAAGVSRKHATIHIARGRVTLQDLGSKNGTWRNDVRVIDAQELADGDHIRVGGVKMIFRSTPAADTTVTIDDSD